MSQPKVPDGIAYMDGRYVPMAEATISVLDWGFLRSDATYDVVHVWQGRFFRLDDHLDRFRRSVDRLHLALPFGLDRVAEVLSQCVRRAGLADAYVEMICTRGVSPTFSRDPRDAVNRFIAFAIPFGWILRPEDRERGLHIAISRVRRIPPESVDPTIKNYHWLDLIAGLFDAYDRGAGNVVLTDGEDNVVEGPGFNVFAVVGGRVTTPDRGVLEGITRLSAIQLCAEIGVPVTTAALPAETLKHADEAFVTSTAGGIMPVTRVDDRPVADGAPGPITRRLIDLYWQKHHDPAWSVPVDP
jgi:branched-chain amino acid aminotransferase